MPVRIARIGWHRAVPADFEGVPFETFIVCDNLYQGYLAINTVTGDMGIKQAQDDYQRLMNNKSPKNKRK